MAPASPQAGGDERWTAAAGLLVVGLTAVRLLAIGLHPYPLYGDEAQYWVWAQTPAWGYFSKPPLIAWIIAATTALVGDSEAGVRVAAPLIHAATALLVGALGGGLYGARKGAVATAIYATLPGVALSSFVISTDAPLLLCWAAALLALVRARDTDRAGWWLLLGVALGLGLLAKYAMAYFLLSLGWYLTWSPQRRALLGNPRLWAALALGMLIYLPNLVWNLTHGLVAYSHLVENVVDEDGPSRPFSLLLFLAGQLAVAGPAFVSMVVVLLSSAWRGADDRFRLLAAFVVPNLAIIALVALLWKSNANWTASCYVAGAVLAALRLGSGGRRRLLQAVLAFNLLANAALYLFHPVVDRLGLPLTPSTDPFNDLLGSDRLGRAVGEAAAGYPDAVLVTTDRMLYAELAFYVRPSRRQLAWNPHGPPRNQFEMTADTALLRRAPLLYVGDEADADLLARHFASVTPVSVVTIPLHPGVARRYAMFALAGYKG